MLLASFPHVPQEPPGPPEAPGVQRPRALVLLVVGYLVAVTIALSMAVARHSDGGLTVSRGDFGPAWPLRTTKGILRCELGREITLQSGGTTYTLNRDARRSAKSDVTPIRADGAGGAKKDLGPLVDRGLGRCGGRLR